MSSRSQPRAHRAGELANKLRRSRLSAIELKDEQDRARDLILEIRSLGSEEAIAAAKTAFPQLRPAEVRSFDKLAGIIAALSTALDDFSDLDGQTATAAPSDTFD